MSWYIAYISLHKISHLIFFNDQHFIIGNTMRRTWRLHPFHFRKGFKIVIQTVIHIWSRFRCRRSNFFRCLILNLWFCISVPLFILRVFILHFHSLWTFVFSFFIIPIISERNVWMPIVREKRNLSFILFQSAKHFRWVSFVQNSIPLPTLT